MKRNSGIHFNDDFYNNEFIMIVSCHVDFLVWLDDRCDKLYILSNPRIS